MSNKQRIYKQKKVIVILTLFWQDNVEQYLIRYLNSVNNTIKYNENLFDIKVILLDNSPKPNINDFLSRNKISLNKNFYKVIDNIGTGFFAEDNNKIAKLAYELFKPNYFLFLNPDTEIKYDAINYLIKTIKNKKVFCTDAKQWPFEHPKYYNKNTLETSWCSGACLLVKSKEFIDWGGFDENFCIYAEDVDLSWRAWENGYRCLYSPKALCVHHCYGLNKNIYFRQLWNIRNGIIMRVKHGNLGDLNKYIGFLIKNLLYSLKTLSYKETKNILKAMFAGILNSIKYINRKNNIVKRPTFSNFFGSEYAKQ